MKPSVRDLEHALSIRRQINALENALPLSCEVRLRNRKPADAGQKGNSRLLSAEGLDEYDHHYGLTLSGTKKKRIGN